MTLELHDNETGNTLFARICNIDYLYQAEQWVIDTQDKAHASVIRWLLYDDNKTLIQTWERPVGSLDFPSVVVV